MPQAGWAPDGLRYLPPSLTGMSGFEGGLEAVDGEGAPSVPGDEVRSESEELLLLHEECSAIKSGVNIWTLDACATADGRQLLVRKVTRFVVVLIHRLVDVTVVRLAIGFWGQDPMEAECVL
jgi:hypothetical protein